MQTSPSHPTNPPIVPIDFSAITSLFDRAVTQNRYALFEHETYVLLKNSGAETPPRTRFLPDRSRPTDEELLEMVGDKVVLKIVSPTIVHKTEVGGVRVVEKRVEKIRSTCRRMMYEVVENYASLIEKDPVNGPDLYRGLSGKQLQQAIRRDIQGILLVQYMPPDSQAFGNELIVGIRNTREFGMVISAGLGGTDTELYAKRFRKGQAIVAASTETVNENQFFELFRRTICYRKLAGLTRGQRRIVTDEQIIECFSSMISLANYYSPINPEAPYLIQELEINPFAFTDYLMVPLDGMCRFSLPTERAPSRPIRKISQLLRPESIGIVGLSTRRINFGRVILSNILAAGFPLKQLRIITPDIDSFEGVSCVPDLSSLDTRLDLLVVAVPSARVPEIIDEVLDHNGAETVMLIAGGMGETDESIDRAKQIENRILETRQSEDGGPLFLGGNCLGVISHPGHFDTLFIPEEKLPKQREKKRRNCAFISQSGAFMITRLSKRPELDPAYMISVGNQNDLTLGDLVNALKDDSEIDVIGIYAEGFKDLDGLHFIQGVRQAVSNGKDIVFYKAGRTPEGKTATTGHTASLAGDYMVCESCIQQAGGIVARSFSEFEELLILSQRLHDREILGNRLAALSGAGFEAVGMADSIHSDEFQMRMANFTKATQKQLQGLIEQHRLEGLVTVKNPLDINPGADDQLHMEAVAILAEDPGVDAIVVGLDPLSPAMLTLPPESSERFSFSGGDSIVQLFPALIDKSSKPIIGVVDGGRLYDPLVDELQQAGLAVFRSSDQAVQTLAAYMEGRLNAERIRQAIPEGQS